MNIEQFNDLKTVTAIYDWHKSKRKDAHRPHLGGSQIGNDCSRALWYQFRHAWSPTFDGRVLRLFETGDLAEDRFVRELRAIGCTVWEVDPDTGKQIRFTACGGHFALSLDGVVEGLPDAPKTPHTLEFKTMNDKNFRALKNLGVQKSKPIYWAQCQIGMHLAGLDRCLFMAVNKNDDTLYAERIHLDLAEALALAAKADGIVFADVPPTRMNDDPSFWLCKFCSYWAVCHGCKIPEVNCRTCANSTPERDGEWSCTKHGKALGVCTDHLFIPPMMPKGWEVLDASPDRVVYHDEEGEVIANEGNSEALFEGRQQ